MERLPASTPLDVRAWRDEVTRVLEALTRWEQHTRTGDPQLQALPFLLRDADRMAVRDLLALGDTLLRHKTPEWCGAAWTLLARLMKRAPGPDALALETARETLASRWFQIVWPETGESPFRVGGPLLLTDNDFEPEEVLALARLAPGESLSFGGGAAPRVEIRRVHEDERLKTLHGVRSSARPLDVER